MKKNKITERNLDKELMRGRAKWLIIVGTVMALMATGCGEQAKQPEATESASETTVAGSSEGSEAESSSEESGAAAESSGAEGTQAADGQDEPMFHVSEDDPAVKELREMVVPNMPSLKEMGEIKLPDLSGIVVEAMPMEEVTDEMVDEDIKLLVGAEKVEVEDASVLGDTVNINFVGSIDGVEFEGGTGDNYDLVLGSHSFIDTFEDQLVGLKAGEETVVHVTFPDDYGKAELAGQPADFAVTINAVKRSPELSDELVAQTEGLDAETVDELRKQRREMMEKGYEYSYHSYIQEEALRIIQEEAEITVSDALKNYADAYRIHYYVKNVEDNGYSITDIMNMYGMSPEELKEELLAMSDEYARQLFIINTIADEQGIKVTNELIDKYAEDVSAMTGTEYNHIKLLEMFGENMLNEEVLRDAVLHYIESQVQVTEAPEEAETESGATEEEGTETTEGAEAAVKADSETDTEATEGAEAASETDAEAAEAEEAEVDSETEAEAKETEADSETEEEATSETETKAGEKAEVDSVIEADTDSKVQAEEKTEADSKVKAESVDEAESETEKESVEAKTGADKKEESEAEAETDKESEDEAEVETDKESEDESESEEIKESESKETKESKSEAKETKKG